MAYDPNALRLGASQIFYNGVDFGFTRDGAQIDVKTTTKRMDIDHFNSIETKEIVLKKEASIKFIVLETTLDTMTLITGRTAAQVSVAGAQRRLSVPVAAGLAMHQSGVPLRIHPVDRDAGDLSEDITFPVASWSGNITFAGKVDDLRMFTVEFFAYRDAQDILFRFGA